MERTPARPLAPARLDSAWTLFGLVLPLVAVALAAFLVVRNLTADGGGEAPAGAIDPGHRERLSANIAFFEARVRETNDHLSYNRLADLYLQRLRETGDPGDVRRAEIAALGSLEAFPGNAGGLLALARVRLAQHDFAAAEAILRPLAEEGGPGADATALLGDARFARGDYDEAGDLYRAYLEAAPGFAAFARSAAIAEVHGNTDLARQFWEAAIEHAAALEPENAAWARVQLGNLLFATGKTAEAGRQFAWALEAFPGYAPALAGTGRVAAARGDMDAAAEAFAAAAASAPLPEHVIPAAEALQRAGRSAEAERQFALVAALRELFAANGIRDDFALTFFALDHGGDVAAALAEAEAAYAARPSLQAADLLAWALYRNGRFEEARARSAEALRTGMKDATFLYHAGMIAAALGDRAEAIRFLEAALELQPAFSLTQAPIAAETLQSLRGGRR